MPICRRQILIWSALLLVTGWRSPALAQPIFVAAGASREGFYDGRVVWGTNRDEDYDYGTWGVSDAPLYLGIYEPQVGYVLRLDHATRSRVVAAECTWFSVPPGASCIWDDEPGSVWMTPNLAATFSPATYLWWRASAGGEPPHPRGANAPRQINGEWVIPMTFRLDQSDRYWHWLGEPADWWAHPAWFARLPVWLGTPDTGSATLRVLLLDDSADFALTVHPAPPTAADFDRDGEVDVPDIFAFLSAWFGGDLAGDWDASGGCEGADIFAFLSEWFQGS